jgi:hypothetical protein
MMILITLFAATLAQSRPELAALPPAQQTTARTFLATSCFTGDDAQKRAALAGIPEGVFWEAYRLGPEPEELVKLQRASADAYKKRVQWLANANSNALSKEELAAQQRVSEAEYVDRKLADQRDRYRSAALIGISVVGTGASLSELRRIAADEKDPMSGAAKAALEALAQSQSAK